MIDPGCTDLNLHFEILQGQAAECILLHTFESFETSQKWLTVAISLSWTIMDCHG